MKLLVRTCEKTYDEHALLKHDIQFQEMECPDGQVPSKEIIKRWLQMCDAFFGPEENQEEKRIAIHCVAGLGRAPFFVALALVHVGCSPENAIHLIRSKRPGSINLTQANFIMSQKQSAKKNAACECTIF